MFGLIYAETLRQPNSERGFNITNKLGIYRDGFARHLISAKDGKETNFRWKRCSLFKQEHYREI